MNRVVTAGLVAALSFQLAATGKGAEQSDKPNILMICIDDLNDWVGALGGHPQAKTPNLDRLLSKSITFTNAHCAAPVCSASRHALMSGLRPSTTGWYSNTSKKLADYEKALNAQQLAAVTAGPGLIGALLVGGLAAFLTLNYVRGVENRVDEDTELVEVVVAKAPGNEEEK